MIAQDFLMNGFGGDLLIQNGDFVIGPSDSQSQYCIIDNAPGYWKESPNVGVGLVLQQNGNVNTTQLGTLIQQQLQLDGFTTQSPTINLNSDGTLNIITNATRN